MESAPTPEQPGNIISPQFQAASATQPVTQTQWLNTLQNQINNIQNQLTDLIRKVSKSFNSEAGSGPLAPLEIVPFHNGSYPSQHIPPLPPLNTYGAFANLDPQSQEYYLRGYYPDEEFDQLTPDERFQKLRRAIGCKPRC